MIHKQFKDLSLSRLGMGTMRLPIVEGDLSNIDMAETQRMVDYAMSHGVNYYDTAWGYHNGFSEAAIGRALSRYPRESYYLATKFPGYDLSNMDKVEPIFKEQLERCGVEYFDFYLIHNVCEKNIDAYLDERYGIMPYLLKEKAAGRIRHLGFSAHGGPDVMKRFLAAYGEHMEFCQLQINYIDWTFQDAKGKVDLLDERGIPVWVMEPLRGGKLASLSDADASRLASLRPDEGIPAWAFRFLQSLPSVVVILSGMSDMRQMEDNVKTFEEYKPLNENEMGAVLGLAKEMVERIALPCTACRYCTGHCPMQLDIPALLELYNEHCFSGGGFIAPMVLGTMSEKKRPSACVGCKSCEKVCPQGIKISEAMADFAERLKQ